MTLVHDKLMELCNGDADAVVFIESFWAFVIVWDDAVDRDKSGGEEHVNAAMMWALFGMHEDPFYRRCSGVLRPAILQCIASWVTANKFERSGDEHLVTQAFFLRDSPYDVLSLAVLLAAGFDRQAEAVEYFHTENRVHGTLADYLKEHLGDQHGMV